MSRNVDAHLTERFAETEALGSCLVPEHAAERNALMRRKQKGASIACPHPGVFVREEFWSRLNPVEQHLALIRALHTLHPDWVFAAFSAAVLSGLDVSYGLLNSVCIATKPGCYTKDKSQLRRVVVRDDYVNRVDGIPVTRPLQTLLDCACMADFPHALAILDSALRDLNMFDKSIKIYFEMNGRNRKGIAKARLAVEHMSSKSANGGESKARAVMIEEGFMLPELQVELTDPVETWRTFIVDFLWSLPDGTLVAGELDGNEKMENPSMLKGKTTAEAFRAERERESHLTARGLRVLRFTPEQVRRREEFIGLLEAFGIPRVRKPIVWK